MIPGFDEVYKLTDTISSETAFSKEESFAFYMALAGLDPGSTILEVGCEFGRSTSILAQMAVAEGHRLVLIEPIVRPELIAMLAALRVCYTLHAMPTDATTYDELPYVVDFLHIDGDHSRDAVQLDCEKLLPLVVPGGLACFHDYGRESLPEVKPAVDAALALNVDGEVWEQAGMVGTLKIVVRR